MPHWGAEWESGPAPFVWEGELKMPKITVEIEWDEPKDEHWLNAGDVAICLHAYCKNTRFKVHELTDRLSASEALFGFVGWLTSRGERTVMSGHDEAGGPAGLVGEFCEANHLCEPRKGWSENLTHPTSAEISPEDFPEQRIDG